VRLEELSLDFAGLEVRVGIPLLNRLSLGVVARGPNGILAQARIRLSWKLLGWDRWGTCLRLDDKVAVLVCVIALSDFF
jgi:hypothetical protein